MHTHSPKQDPQLRVQDHPTSGQQFDHDVHVKISLGFGIGIVLASVLTMIGMWIWLNQYLNREALLEADRAPRVEQAPPPEPRLQIHPEQDLQAFVLEQNAHLESYGWTEQSQDYGHIAIEDAMKLVVEQRLPVRNQPRQWENPLLWRDHSLLHANPGGGH